MKSKLTIERVIRKQIELDIVETTPTNVLRDLILSLDTNVSHQSNNGCEVFNGSFGGYYETIVLQKVGEFNLDHGNEAFAAVGQDYPHALFVRINMDEKD